MEFIGQKAVKDITVTNLVDFRNLQEKLPSRPFKAPLHKQVNAEGEKISPVRVENMLKELSSVFHVAVEDGMLTRNPPDKQMKRKVAAGTKVVRSFSRDEIWTAPHITNVKLSFPYPLQARQQIPTGGTSIIKLSGMNNIRKSPIVG